MVLFPSFVMPSENKEIRDSEDGSSGASARWHLTVPMHRFQAASLYLTHGTIAFFHELGTGHERSSQRVHKEMAPPDSDESTAMKK